MGSGHYRSTKDLPYLVGSISQAVLYFLLLIHFPTHKGDADSVFEPGRAAGLYAMPLVGEDLPSHKAAQTYDATPDLMPSPLRLQEPTYSHITISDLCWETILLDCWRRRSGESWIMEGFEHCRKKSRKKRDLDFKNYFDCAWRLNEVSHSHTIMRNRNIARRTDREEKGSKRPPFRMVYMRRRKQT